MQRKTRTLRSSHAAEDRDPESKDLKVKAWGTQEHSCVRSCSQEQRSP